MRAAFVAIAVWMATSGCDRSRSAPVPEAPAVAASAAATPVSPSRDPSKEPLAIGPGADTFDLTGVVGAPAPAWDVVGWLDGTPRTIEGLRGQVVLVRWFTEGCPYCAATAPTLVALDRALAPRGLAVIGIYHHKSDEPMTEAGVRALADRFQFRFPVAIDPDWRTLDRWWLDAHPGWTSVSFVIDRRGVIRFVHTGGAYAPDSPDAAQVRRWVEQLLAEPA